MNNIKTKINLLLLLSVIFLYGNDNFKLTENSYNDYILTVSSGNYSLESKSLENNLFNSIISDSIFDGPENSGMPKLPNKAFTLCGDFDYEIIDCQYDTLKNINIEPGSRPLMIAPDFYDTQKEPLYGKPYELNQYWPKDGILSTIKGKFRGTTVTTIKVSPFKYNPISKTLLSAKKLSIRFINKNTSINRKAFTNPILANVVKNSPVNRNQRSDYEESGRAGKIVIFTIDSLLPAVDILAKWQKLKGYDVVVESKPERYSKADVISKIDSELTQSDAVSKYMLIFGNTKMVEEYEVDVRYFNGVGNMQGVSCSRYGDTEGNDHLPEISRGVVPANNLAEAMICVNKFIQYETKPNMDPSTYNNILGASQQGFTHEYVDTIMDYMDTKGYITTPRYYQTDDSQEVIDRMNSGTIIAAQYDHGYRGGWATPEFTNNEIKTLTNGDKLSYMYSINCLSGSWDYANGIQWWPLDPVYDPNFYGLTERFLFKENGGGVGALGATNITYTGFNDFLLYGLFKATWPEDETKTPVYRMGDVVDQALFHMHENMGINSKWGPDDADEEMCDYHFMLYHNQCDPTLQLRTKTPIVTTASYNPYFTEEASLFSISSINLDDGTAVLYNEENGTVIGRAKINNGTANIPLTEDSFKNNDEVTLAINGINCVPIIKSFIVGQETANLEQIKTSETLSAANIKVLKNGFKILNNCNNTIEMQLWNSQGKKVTSKNIVPHSKMFINKSNLNIATGTFFIRLISPKGMYRTKLVL